MSMINDPMGTPNFNQGYQKISGGFNEITDLGMSLNDRVEIGMPIQDEDMSIKLRHAPRKSSESGQNAEAKASCGGVGSLYNINHGCGSNVTSNFNNGCGGSGTLSNFNSGCGGSGTLKNFN